QRITNEFALSLGFLLLALLLLVLNLVKFYAVRGLARVISIFGTVVIVCIIVGKLVYTTWGHIPEPEDMTDRMVELKMSTRQKSGVLSIFFIYR
ncbi:MAG: hypothetical protein ABUK18_11025, partial [Candidatus Bathyarchaeia archaeon]